MWCSLNSRTGETGTGVDGRRRATLLAASGLLSGWSHATSATDLPSGAGEHRPPELPASLSRRGSGRFRRFGFHIYDATLWAGPDVTQPPLALELTYRRDLRGRDIARASVDEMRRVGASDAALERWGAQMQQLFPDVRDGDRIVGLQEVQSARFWFNGRPLGRIDGAEFARHFFGIWLDPRTSAPGLRAALLG